MPTPDLTPERKELLRLHNATRRRAATMAFCICDGIVTQLDSMTVDHVAAFCKKFLLDQHIAGERAAIQRARGIDADA